MTYAITLTALSDPTRRNIFEEIHQHPQSVSQIARNVPVSRPAVSQHLKVLSDAGLVTMRKNGNRNIYHAAPGGLDDLRAYFEKFWSGVLDSFQTAAELPDGGNNA